MSIGFANLRHALFQPSIIKDRKDGKVHNRHLFLNIGLLLTLLFVSVLYLVQVNTLSTKGYTIKSLQNHIAQEKRDQQNLQMKSIEAGSLGLVQQKINTMQLVPSERIDYLASTHSVAVR